ncbi:MAG: AI-2E family transporter [Trueperaceae bacterium]|nr:AI-2E family transporter [Trueperaceae bacterium]
MNDSDSNSPDTLDFELDDAPKRGVTAFEIVWRSPWVRVVSYVTAVTLLVWLLWSLRGGYGFALEVAIIGFVIAYVLNPVVVALERIRVRRPFGVVIVYIMLLLLLVLGSVLITQVVVETERFVRLIPGAVDAIIAYLEGASQNINDFIDNLPGFITDRFDFEPPRDILSEPGADDESAPLDIARDTIQNFLAQAAIGLNNTLETLVSQSGDYLLTGGRSILSGVTSILSTTFQVFLILLASAYFLYDYPKFVASFKRYVPVRWRPLYNDISAKADRAVGGYLRGQILITTILGLFIWFGLTMIGVPLAVAISFIAAVFNLIPYLGPIVGVVPAVLLGFTVSPLTALLAVGVFVIANQIEGNLLAPFILSKSTDLHPVTVLLAILAGVGLLGLVGALLAVPVVALAKVILEEYLLKRPAYQVAAEIPDDGPPGEETSDGSSANDTRSDSRSNRRARRRDRTTSDR